MLLCDLEEIGFETGPSIDRYVRSNIMQHNMDEVSELGRDGRKLRLTSLFMRFHADRIFQRAFEIIRWLIITMVIMSAFNVLIVYTRHRFKCNVTIIKLSSYSSRCLATATVTK